MKKFKSIVWWFLWLSGSLFVAAAAVVALPGLLLHGIAEGLEETDERD